MRLSSLLLLSILTVQILGCATAPDYTRQRFESLPNHYNQFDLALSWEYGLSQGQTRIDGVVKNMRYAYMYDLEIWVMALGPTGKVQARSVSYVIPSQLPQDQIAPFSLKLPVALTPGTVLRFTYRYRGSDAGDGNDFGGGTNWMQSFETTLQ